MFLNKFFGKGDAKLPASQRRPVASTPVRRIDVGIRQDASKAAAQPLTNPDASPEMRPVPAAAAAVAIATGLATSIVASKVPQDRASQDSGDSNVVSLKRARQVAAKDAVSDSSTAAAATTEIVGARQGVTSSPLTSNALPIQLAALTDIPHDIVLASTTGPFQVSEQLQGEIAVLRVDSGSVVVITTAKQYKAAPHLSLLERIKKERCRVTAEYLADSGLITALYSGAKKAGVEDADSARTRELDELVARCMQEDASDIHIMRRKGSAAVKMRRNGGLELVTTWSSDYAAEMARTIHAIAEDGSKEATFSETEGQGMMVPRTIGGQMVQLRVQTTPTYPDGMDIVMRILKSGSTAKPIPLPKLGYSPSHVEMIEYMMRTPWGVIVFAGETGSGKSTSLFTVMTEIAVANEGLKIYTVEDPPEYNMERYGITQIPVIKKRNETVNPFNKNLKNLMRLDPDIAMIGEIRDGDSAEAVVNLVRSGHKLTTTVHAPGAMEILDRMRGFGVDTQTMASRGFISGLVAQRLAPTLCAGCKLDYNRAEELGTRGLHDRIRAVTAESDTLFIKGPGCSLCKNTGVDGRTVLAEIVIPDGKMLELLREEKFQKAYEHWRSFRQGHLADINKSMVGMTILEHGILKMRLGLIAPDELERSVGPLTHGELEASLVGGETADLLSERLG